ncbi:MAG: formate dehydrogenase accessory protein FdhE [candidate division NC10 bacterium]|nr:formate dehydrogenase accessory protein FdhE [candidate division NC10 bacterium]
MDLSDRLREIHRVVRDARADVEPVRMDPATATLRLRAGQPLLAGASVPVDEKVAARLLREICRIVATPQAAWLLDAAGQRPIPFQAMADALLAGQAEALADTRGVPAAYFAFVVLAALRPSFRRHAESLEPLTEDVPWHRPLCPICGSVPSLAELRGDPGRRYLRCALCEGAWRVPRLRCPFCATTDHTRLRYLRIEEEPEMRLDLCDACRRYLKTRIAPGGEAEPDPFGRDLATLHLDALAWERGYESAAPATPPLGRRPRPPAQGPTPHGGPDTARRVR